MAKSSETRIDVERILKVLAFSERLKTEMRHSWLSNGRRESVAEHTWQMAFLAMLIADSLDCEIDLLKVLKMIIIHDLVEAEVGDIPFTEQDAQTREKKEVLEKKAIENIRNLIASQVGEEIYSLWHELEDKASDEAKLVKALDNLEVQIQHNFASLDTWEEAEFDLVYTKMDKHCTFDTYLIELCQAVKSQAERAMTKHGVDIAEVRNRVGQALA